MHQSGFESWPHHAQRRLESPRTLPRSPENADPVPGSPDPESVLPATASDQPATRDQLGFAPYVRALAAFLLHPQTEGPLTVSVEGEWGSGKSSFMLQLEEELLRPIPPSDPKTRPALPPLTVNFNPWRHDKDDAVWASFALHFAREVTEQLPLFQRWLAYFRLMLLRFNWREGWSDALRAASVVLLLVVLALLIPIAVHLGGWARVGALSEKFFKAGESGLPADATFKRVFDWGVASGGVLGYVAVALSLWMRLLRHIKNPLAIDLKKYLDTPNYQDRVSFVEKFHEDFERMVRACAGNRRVFVFIDDLDRCEVPRAADLMQALNLMISSNPRLIFILGMDREKVAAGIAVKNEKLLPYLAMPDGSGGTNTFSPLPGIEFGYTFIEKFIQVPFLVPRPGQADLERFLRQISETPPAPVRPVSVLEGWRKAARDWWRGTHWLALENARATVAKPLSPGGEAAGSSLPDPASTPAGSFMFFTGEDSAKIREIVLMVAPIFENNPRRLETVSEPVSAPALGGRRDGAFRSSFGCAAGTAPDPAATGKFTALLLRWPLLIDDLTANRNLLDLLQRLAVSPRAARAMCLPRRRAGCTGTDCSRS